MRRALVITITMMFILLAACSGVAKDPTSSVAVVGQGAVAGGSYRDVSVADLQDMLESKDFVLVNVHVPFEGNIASTDLSIPYDQIEQNSDQLPDKNAKIVLYCRSGRMSTIAAETLVSLGYTDIWNLSGGMVAWEQAGLTIEH